MSSPDYQLLKVANVDVPRLRSMQLDGGLPGVLIDAAPYSYRYSIVACPVDGDAADNVRAEVASETISVDELRQMHQP